MGLLYAIPGILGLALRIPAGALSTILGRKKILRFGCVFAILCPLLLAFRESFTSLFLAAFFYGFANLFPISAISLVHDVVPSSKKTLLLGYYSMWGGIGRTAGTLAAGFILHFTHSYQAVFLLAAICAFLAFLFIQCLPSSSSEDLDPVSRQLYRDLRDLKAKPELLFASAARGIQGLVMGTFNTYFPWYAKEIALLLSWQIGFLQAMVTATSLVTRAVTGIIPLHKKPRLYITGSIALSGFFLFLLSQTSHFLLLLPIVSVIGIAEGVTYLSTLAFASEIAGVRLFGAAVGLLGTFTDFGMMAGRFFPGVFLSVLPLTLSPHLQYTYAFTFMGGAVVCSSALATTLLLPSERRKPKV